MINIGNIDYAPADKIIDIRDKDQEIKAKYVIDAKDVHKHDLMGEHYIEFSFELDSVVTFVRTDYIIWEGSKFTLRKDYKPTQENSQRYTYTLKFEAPEILLQDAEMFYLRQDLKEGEWSLTSNAASFIKIAVDNANRYFSTTDWQVGTIEPVTTQFITFNSANVFDALTQIAETFKAEWYITGNTIHLVNKHQLGSEIEFENEVSVASIFQSDGEAISGYTRIVALGSTRNIPANYRPVTSGEGVDAIYQKRLRIPVSKGSTIDAKPNMSALEAVETTVIFEDVYPKRIGTLSGITTKEYTDTNETTQVVTKWNAYRYKDTGLSFKESYLLPGVELRIVFQSGKLNGMDFAVKFNPDNKAETDPNSQIFEIIRSEDYGKALPNETLKPENGDQYILYGFNIDLVASQYVPAAELELYNKGVAWLTENLKDKSVYTCPTAINHFAKNEMDLDLGQKVKLVKSLGGNRNYVRNSALIKLGLTNATSTWMYVSGILPGEEVTISATSAGIGTMVVYRDNGYATAATLSFTAANQRKSYTFTKNDTPSTILFIIRGCDFLNVQLEKGNKATDWSLAPEDVQATCSSRIMGFEKKLINKYDAVYTIGDNSSYSRLNNIEKQIEELKYAGQIFQSTGGNGVYLIKQFDNTTPSEFNAYSATASNARYLNKQTGGTVQGDTTFQKDAKILGKAISDTFQNDTFTSGQFGSGFKMWKEANGQSYAEFDNLMVRREMIVNTLTIAEIKSVGGQILISPANMYVSKVEEISDSYRCYFDTANGTITNQFALDDQVICRKFNGANIKYYWCRVLGIGSDYIRISKTDKDGSGIPSSGDEIIQFGNRTNTARQSAIMISAYGSDAPSIKQYAGINSYNLTGKEVTVISPAGNKFTGEFIISSSGKSVTTEINDSINNIQVSPRNYLRRKAQKDGWLLNVSGCATIQYTTEYMRISTITNMGVYRNLTDVITSDLNGQAVILSFDLRANWNVGAKISQSGAVQTPTLIKDQWQRIFLRIPSFTSASPLVITNLSSSIWYDVKDFQITTGTVLSNFTEAPEDVQDRITAAQTAADNAQTAATAAQTSATTANNLLADIANDNIFDVAEKQNVLKEWQIIQGEYPTITAQAATYGISSLDYTTKYNSLNSYITPLLANMTVNSTIVGTTFRLTFKVYYDAKIALLKAITDKAKQLADMAQSSANDANTVAQAAQTAATNAKNAADAAQSTANTAKINADTANNLLSDIANDNKFDPSEKQSTKKEWDAIISEYSKNITQASTFGVASTAYTNAYNSLNSYITPLLSNLSLTSDIVGTTFRSTFKTYYDARLDLLNAIASKARDLANSAQTAANNAQTTADSAVTRVSAAESSISVMQGQITLKVNQTDFNSLQGRVSTAESSIIQQAGQITSTAEKVDAKNAAYKSYTNVSTDRPNVPYSKGDLWITYDGVIKQSQNTRLSGAFISTDWVDTTKYTDDSAVNNLQISPRNYLRRKVQKDGWTVNVSGSATIQYTTDYVRLSTITNMGVYRNLTDSITSDLSGQAVILSFDMRANWNVGARISQSGVTQNVTLVKDQWQRIFLRIPSFTSTSPLVITNLSSSIWYDVKDFQITTGTVLSNFTEAPEDVQDRITAAQIAADNAATAADTAQSTANSKNQTFYLDTQPSTPSGGFKEGDVWYKINTVDGCYETYRWNGSTWTIINVNVSKAKQTITDNSITNLVTKTGIDNVGIGETLWSKINQTADQISLEIGKIQIGSRNYIRNSSRIYLGKTTGDSTWVYVSGILPGEEVTISATSAGIGTMVVYRDDGYATAATLSFTAANQRKSYTFTKNAKVSTILLIIKGCDFLNVQLEKGNKATDWSEAPEDTQTKIDAAQTSATNAKNAADAAQSTANTAKTNADTANNLLSDIANDNKFDPSEKQSTKKEWDAIISEYGKNIAQAATFGLATTGYQSAYNALSSYITPLLSNLNLTSDIVGTTFRSTFKTYYDARTDLLNAIAAKSKQLADTAQTTANSKVTADEVKTALTLTDNKISLFSKDIFLDGNTIAKSIQASDLKVGSRAGLSALEVLKDGTFYAKGSSGTNSCLVIDSGNQSIEIISPVSDSYGGVTQGASKVSISTQTGGVRVSNDSNNVAIVSTNGIFANTAGQGMYPASTTINAKASIVGLGWGNIAKDIYSDNNFVAGVYGSATNSGTAPSFGGYFDMLRANGLYLAVRRISSNTTLNRYDCYVSCYNMAAITVYLPPSPYTGLVIYLRQMNSTGFTIHGNGINIHTDGNDYPSVGNRAGRGDTTMLVYDGQYWCLNYMAR